MTKATLYMRHNISSGAKWEDIVGYSRAVVVDNRVHVAGTTGIGPDGEVVGGPYEQAKRALEIIGKALEQAGSSLENVYRTRIFVRDINLWQEVGRAHGEIFRDIKPASTLIGGVQLVNPDMFVEIEVDAYI